MNKGKESRGSELFSFDVIFNNKDKQNSHVRCTLPDKYYLVYHQPFRVVKNVGCFLWD